MKKVKAQKALDQVQIGNGPNHWPLENVFDFCYLGHHFVADGDSMHAVEVRLAMASTRFGELRHLWKSRDLPKRLKLQLYESGVCSILTHSHEAWKLDEATCRKLRAWNGRNLAIINSGDLPSLGAPGALSSRTWSGHFSDLFPRSKMSPKPGYYKVDLFYPSGLGGSLK